MTWNKVSYIEFDEKHPFYKFNAKIPNYKVNRAYPDFQKAQSGLLDPLGVNTYSHP